ncbi:Protein-disulfide isomerase [Gemmobacter aquatilis]|uniref:Protein-disulfide isomerase n=1 Tax=Gemmobacter aquatilis TaxID=933059 RepID=A0A1H8K023_9RHOB|nr:DsbA family protein [Gemmobacter aquatilis]SEN85768.1 Protein-disulfide isomerase [Gemmobacter aquatilis]
MNDLTRRRLMGLALSTALVSAMGLPAFAEGEDAALPEVPELVLGSPDAKVELKEYASYTCPHCANFHSEVFKQLKADYIDTGKVRFVFREVYFDRYGLWAAILARCGGEMRYFGLNGILFDKQKDWAASDDPAVVIANLKTIGKAAGLADAQMEACFADQKFAEALVANFQKTMEADGVDSTPTLFINGTKHSNMSYSDLKALLDAELAK